MRESPDRHLMADGRVALIRELERADEAAAAELAEVDELVAGVLELRERALELREFCRSLPEEREAAARAAEEAVRALAEARAAAERAAEASARAQEDADPERVAEARRFEVRARDSLHMAERRAESARAQMAELEARAEAAGRETAALEARARELSSLLQTRPRLAKDTVGEPDPGAPGAAEWATRARAVLLVARSQIAAEREAFVRQANELGTLVLGETLPPLGAAAVTRRVERELGA
jgi:chromosome segregation ATPase